MLAESILLVSFFSSGLLLRPAFTDPLPGWESVGLFFSEVQLVSNKVMSIDRSLMDVFMAHAFFTRQLL